MSDLESKKGETGGGTSHSVHQDMGLDIEKALSFIDSEEYQEPPTPIRDKKPLTRKAPVVQPIPQKDSNTARPGKKEPLRPRKVEEVPLRKTVVPTGGAEGRKTGKIWILFVGAAVLIVLAMFLI